MIDIFHYYFNFKVCDIVNKNGGVAAIIGLREPWVAETLNSYLDKLQIPFITPSMVVPKMHSRLKTKEEVRKYSQRIFSLKNLAEGEISEESRESYEFQMRPHVTNAIIDLMKHYNWYE